MEKPLYCKDRGAEVGACGECLSCDAEAGEACRWSAEGGKPDRASRVVARPAGAPSAREAA